MDIYYDIVKGNFVIKVKSLHILIRSSMVMGGEGVNFLTQLPILMYMEAYYYGQPQQAEEQ